MNQKAFIYGFTTTVVSVGAGATAAAFITPPANCNLVQFQVPRNDLALRPFTAGGTLTLSELTAGQSLGFPLTTMALYSFPGSPAFALFTGGAAASVPVLFGLSSQGGTFRP